MPASVSVLPPLKVPVTLGPNVTGAADGFLVQNQTTTSESFIVAEGAFARYKGGKVMTANMIDVTNKNCFDGLRLNASNSSSIYGKNSRVQTESAQYFIMVKY